MEFLTDERAQAIQIGAVLLFGILILFLSLYQAFVVPDQNEEIEFNHNEELQQQLTELRSNVILMPGSTSTRAASVDLGVRYPSRAVFVNPGPASGTLRTVGTDNPRVNVTITNATAVDDAGETRDFWNGTALSYETGALEYRPGYNLYQHAPRTVYEHSVLYNAFERGNVTQAITGQTLVDGRRITVIALDGSLTENRVGSLSVDVDPISTRSRVVELDGTGDPVTLRMPTGMSRAEWNETFEDERVANGGHVRNVTVSGGGPGSLGMLEVTLEAGHRYQLELAKVGVGVGATGTDAAYLTDVAGNGTVLEFDERESFTVEVRDRFNVPQSGVTVRASPENGTLVGPSTKTTDNEGQATFDYRGTSPGTDRINFTIDPGHDPSGTHDATSPTNVTMTVEVESPPSAGGGGGQAAYNTTWLDPSAEPGTENCDEDSCTLNYTQAQELDLTATTSPAADGAPVDFAVEDRGIGTVTPGQNVTNAGGQASTTFEPQANGTVNVYAWSGGSGDTIEIEVVNFGVGDGPNLQIDEVRGLEDGNTSTDYQPEIQISEVNGEMTSGLEVSLVVVGDTEGEVFNGTKPPADGDISGDTTNASFNVGTLDPDDYTYTVEADADNADAVDQTGTFTVASDPFFDVTITGTNSPVTEGETLTVDVNVTNTGGRTGTQTLNLTDTGFNDTVRDTTTVTLDPGESNTITLAWGTDTGDAGSGDVTVFSENDSDATGVTVNEPAFFEVEITGTNSPVTEGETLAVDVNVTNTGDVTATQTLNLTDTDFNGLEQDTVDVTLDGGQFNNSITLEWDTSDGDAGTGDVTVFSENASDTSTVEVTPSMANRFTVDQSSAVTVPGNNADISFVAENTGGNDIVLTGIAVNDTVVSGPDPVTVDHTVVTNEFIGNESGRFDGQIDIGGPSVSLDQDAVIQGSSSQRFWLGEFLRSNGNTKSMTNSDVDLTFFFADGSELQVTLNVGSSGGGDAARP